MREVREREKGKVATHNNNNKNENGRMMRGGGSLCELKERDFTIPLQLTPESSHHLPVSITLCVSFH